jgi:hypothetical protein
VGNERVFNRTRVAGHLNEIEGVVANMFAVLDQGALALSIG